MSFNLGLPQIIMLVIFTLGLGINLAKDGQYKTEEKYSFGVSFVATVINVAVLYWGGFFG